jgi:hypothetical protein
MIDTDLLSLLDPEVPLGLSTIQADIALSQCPGDFTQAEMGEEFSQDRIETASMIVSGEGKGPAFIVHGTDG